MEPQLQELEQEMIDAAMHIITEAGDARVEVGKSLECMEKGDFITANQHLSAARKLLAKAHGMQTEIIQSEAEGELRQHPLLFIHAQDTLMTVNSEINMARKMQGIFERIETRLANLEKAAN